MKTYIAKVQTDPYSVYHCWLMLVNLRSGFSIHVKRYKIRELSEKLLSNLREMAERFNN